MEQQYKERGIYKVRQNGTKDFVAFKTREEKLAEKLADGEKKRALILQKLNTFISDMDNLAVDYQVSGNPKSWWFQLRDGKDFWNPEPDGDWTKSACFYTGFTPTSAQWRMDEVRHQAGVSAPSADG